ncbi:N-acetylmuramoyl-L-alanine amidase [Peptostreptococcus faecalis]|uniref:N-acetylmuramoyl-L-alanine amidase n=1 Tax=Peptostreptococcus faecalis TaxID=2045015 RepID=UPI000C7D614B|nr:N-acetylmuramoyl-L-alanine amidase [Peptostreptococcus faecalis]
MKKTRMRNRKRKKIDIKKLLFVLFVFILAIFLVIKIISGVFGIFQKNMNKKSTSNTQVQQETTDKKIRTINIAIDAERGGNDTGPSTKNKNIPEKEINMKIADEINDVLSKHKDVKVKMIRTSDEYKTVNDKVKIIKDNNIDIFVSIRLNYQSNRSDASGIDTYYNIINTETADDEKSVKDKVSNLDENKSKNSENDATDKKNESEGKNNVSKIVNKTMSETSSKAGSEEKDLSETLATSIQNTSVSFVEMKDRGIYQKEIGILKEIEIPAAIVHCGFVTNQSDSEILESDQGIKKIANGIAEGILLFIDHNKNELIGNKDF